MRIEKPIGKYSEQQARKNLKMAIPVLVISYIFLLLTGLDYLPFYINLGKVAPAANFVSGAFFMYGLVQFLVPYKYWKSGLTGEKRVEKNLFDKLTDEYSIFNNVLLRDPKKRGDIDHIIVGPTGIYIIETKNNQGKISFNGFLWKGVKGSPSQQARDNMFRVKDVLKNCPVFRNKNLFLEHVVLFSNPNAEISISREPEYGCKVIHFETNSDNILADFITNQPILFSDHEVAKIEQCLRAAIVN